MKTCKININGIVQGVGFRPFIYSLAKKYNLNGTVTNTDNGVEIIININDNKINPFVDEIKNNCPPLAHISKIKYEFVEKKDLKDFKIINSQNEGGITFVSPDTAICKDCERELFDKNDRRYLHPFINCTNCGPRYNIIKNIPYDRKTTVMSDFSMCQNCFNEYHNPLNRRFHAQPICCNECGPEVYSGNLRGIDAIKFIAEKINEGEIVAVKGLGGYHIICNATDSKPVEKLRKLKNRFAKPFAIMATMNVIKELPLSAKEKDFINSPQAPIVIVNWKNNELSDLINPLNNRIGLMKSYTPLHVLILNFTNTNFIVATSGNLKDEPIVTEEGEAEKKLSKFTKYFLHHNRRIHNGIDDSVATVINDKIYIIRRARGFAPYPVSMPFESKAETVGLGAHLKSTITLQSKNFAFVSQYIGDLDNFETTEFYNKTYEKMCHLFGISPEIAICDYHINYYSSEFAEKSKFKIKKIQHHLAHMFSCMAENGLKDDVIGIIFDGTGLGKDNAIWGGEIFSMKKGQIIRDFYLKYIKQPGGDASAKNPYMMLISYLIHYGLIDKFINFLTTDFGIKANEISLISQMIEKSINSNDTSSMGRFFEAVGSLLSKTKTNEFEGHTAIILESMAEKAEDSNESYNFEIKNGEISHKLFLEELAEDFSNGVDKNMIALKFHNTIVEIITECCLTIKNKKKLKNVVLSGGVFQNILLLKKTILKLEENGFDVFIHSKVPTNDGGISLGQIYGNVLNFDYV